MTFTEEWFCAASQRALGDLYDKVSHLEGRVIEIGCWEGRSTCALANACYPETVFAVDTWKGSPGEISADLAKERNVFATFKANVAELTRGNVTACIGSWRGFFAGTRHAEPVKFIHIDATHSYLEVKENIETVLPLMVRGGIICGDDAHHPPVQQAVLDVFGSYNTVATLWWVKVGGD